MTTYHFAITTPRPYFAELPYYLWGEVNHDSEGDCERPTDRSWTWLYLKNRDTAETVQISSEGANWEIEGVDPSAVRSAVFLTQRCGAVAREKLNTAGEWDLDKAMTRALRVAKEFEQSDLAPFDSQLFWGSWKWIGWFGTDFTWVGRWIMHSVVRNDPRAVSLCINWLKQGTVSESQSAALRYALSRLTGAKFDRDKDWVRWYEGGFLSRGHKTQYPEPNLDSWLADLKAQSYATSAS